MGFYEMLALSARVAQAILSLIVLGTCAYVVSADTVIVDDAGDTERFTIPQANFNIFVAVWSLLIVGYQIAVPRFSDALGHKFIVLGLDALTALFWFAGFIALSVYASSWSDFASLGGFSAGTGLTLNWYHTLQAACAFGAFAWISFMITTVLSAINVFRGNTGSAKHNHDMGVVA